jgi:hypothetical protein
MSDATLAAMHPLLRNAVYSIQLGVEDYHCDDPRRPLSAARNFFAGVLLLAKYAILEAAPGADPDMLIGDKLKLVLDGNGGVKPVIQGSHTIGFAALVERLRDFQIEVDQPALKALDKLRNDIEHRYTTRTATDVREVIATVFPVVADLCRHIGREPQKILGDAWSSMLKAKDLFNRELASCHATFAGVKWSASCLATAPLTCLVCASPLVSQEEPQSDDPERIEAICRSCGETFTGPEIVEHALEGLFGGDDYEAARDGSGWQTVHRCPSCERDTYLMDATDPGCALCGHDMGFCDLCECQLGPDNVSMGNDSYCGPCDYRINKDD